MPKQVTHIWVNLKVCEDRAVWKQPRRTSVTAGLWEPWGVRPGRPLLDVAGRAPPQTPGCRELPGSSLRHLAAAAGTAGARGLRAPAEASPSETEAAKG